MRKRELLTLIGSVCLILVLAATIPFTAEGAPITIKVSTTESPTSIGFVCVEKCVRNIEARSNGRLRFELYPLNQLVEEKQAFDAVKSGAVDMIAMSMALFEGIVPLEGGFRVPFLYQSRDHTLAAWQAGQKDLIQKEFEKHNQKVLGFSNPTTRGSVLFTTFPVKGPADLKGKKIRVTGGQGKAIAAAGGAPVTMPASEYYMALKMGTIDGLLTGIELGIGRSLQEVVKYACPIDLDWASKFFAMNLAFFNKLPSDLQTIIINGFDEYWEIAS